MQIYWLILGVLAVWRLTHLLNAEDGPWDLVFKLRRWAGSGFWAGLMDCFYCLSLWMAAPLAVLIGEQWIERAILWPALSAGAILLERWAPDRSAPQPHDDQIRETSDVLWREQTAVDEPGSRNNAEAGIG